MKQGQAGFPPTGPNDLDMKWRLIYWLLMQGLGVVVMAVGLYVLYQDRREERVHSQGCNERLVEMSEKQLELMREVREYLKNQEHIQLVKRR